MELQFVFRGVAGAEPLVLSPGDLQAKAIEFGLEAAAPGRFSAMLVAQLFAYEHRFGLDPGHVVAEIRRIEGAAALATSTKPAAPFKGDGRLAGLWHKHFTSSLPSMVAANILAARPKAVLLEIARQELGQANGAAQLARFVDRIVVDGYERRASADALTGEWIVYLPHEGQNWYLCLATHAGGDEEVLRHLRGPVVAELPFLREVLPALFAD